MKLYGCPNEGKSDLSTMPPLARLTTRQPPARHSSAPFSPYYSPASYLPLVASSAVGRASAGTSHRSGGGVRGEIGARMDDAISGVVPGVRAGVGKVAGDVAADFW